MSFSRSIIIIVCSLFILSCRADSAREHMLFDFETDCELDRLEWQCHTLYSLSGEHVTHGKRSLKMELYPSDYPGIEPMLKNNNWSGYKRLCFDIYNPGEKLKLSLRIDDHKAYPDYGDRYNRAFILESGMNKMSIPLNSLVTPGMGRNLNLKNIQRLMIFTANPGKKVILYVDYMRLVR